jgi:hypothetical protein
MESKDIFFDAFSKGNPPAIKPFMSRVGDVVITRRLSLAEY